MRGASRSRGSDMGRHMEMLGIKVPQKAAPKASHAQNVSDTAGIMEPASNIGVVGPTRDARPSQQHYRNRKRAREEEQFRSCKEPKVDAVVPALDNVSDPVAITEDPEHGETRTGDDIANLHTTTVVDSLEDLLEPIQHKGKIKKLTVVMELEDGEIISLVAEM